jgi:hypothetical protein
VIVAGGMTEDLASNKVEILDLTTGKSNLPFTFRNNSHLIPVLALLKTYVV